MDKDVSTLEEREKLIKLFEQFNSFLTQTQNQAFQLYFFENLSYQEIANILATTRSAAYDSVNKAIKKLTSISNKMNNN